MKIPNVIRIGGVDYEIEEHEHLNNGVNVLCGSIDYTSSTIKLNYSNQKHQYKCISLLHEIIHGIIHHANLEIDESSEEKIVDTVAKGIYQVLQDNGHELFDIEKGDDG